MGTSLNFDNFILAEKNDFFSCYAEAYKQAAKTLLKTQTTAEDSFPPKINYNIIPNIFLYRHTVELYLKTLIIEKIKLITDISNIYEIDINQKKRIKKLFQEHKLSALKKQLLDFINTARNIIEQDITLQNILNKTDENFFSAVAPGKGIVCQGIEYLVSLDDNSFNFRYPLDKDMNFYPSISSNIEITKEWVQLLNETTYFLYNYERLQKNNRWQVIQYVAGKLAEKHGYDEETKAELEAEMLILNPYSKIKFAEN